MHQNQPKAGLQEFTRSEVSYIWMDSYADNTKLPSEMSWDQQDLSTHWSRAVHRQNIDSHKIFPIIVARNRRNVESFITGC